MNSIVLFSIKQNKSCGNNYKVLNDILPLNSELKRKAFKHNISQNEGQQSGKCHMKDE